METAYDICKQNPAVKRGQKIDLNCAVLNRCKYMEQNFRRDALQLKKKSCWIGRLSGNDSVIYHKKSNTENMTLKVVSENESNLLDGFCPIDFWAKSVITIFPQIPERTIYLRKM